jgi:hypothetical protein
MPTTGSLTSRSLSLMMRLGRPAIFVGQGLLGTEEVGDAGMSAVEVVFVDPLLFAGVGRNALVLALVQVEAEAGMSEPGPPHVHE